MRTIKQRFHWERKFSHLGRLSTVHSTLVQISRCSSITHLERTNIINAEKCIKEVLNGWKDSHNELLAFQSFERGCK